MARNRGSWLATLVSGSALSQTILYAATPLIARIYEPEFFGQLGLVVSASIIVSHLISFKYDAAVLAEKAEDAGRLCLLACSLPVLTLTVVACAVVVAKSFFDLPAEWVDQFGAATYGVLVLSLAVALNMSLTSLLVRNGEMLAISTSRVLQSVILVFLQLILYRALEKGFSLILAQCSSVLLVTAYLAYKIRVSNNFIIASSFDEMRQVARRYSDYPKYVTLSTLVGNLGVHFPIVLLSFYAGAGTAGAYFMALRLVQAPISVAGQAVGQVFMADAADLHCRGELGQRTFYVLSLSSRVIVFPAIAVFFIVDSATAIVLGSEWDETREIIRWLLPWMTVVLIASPLSGCVNVLGIQKKWLLFQTFFLLSRIALLFGGIVLFAPIVGIALYAVAGFLGWLLAVGELFRTHFNKNAAAFCKLGYTLLGGCLLQFILFNIVSYAIGKFGLESETGDIVSSIIFLLFSLGLSAAACRAELCRGRFSSTKSPSA